MPIFQSKFFKESQLAHVLLDGMKGLEIGGSAHNAFGLDTVNVDRFPVHAPIDHPESNDKIILGFHPGFAPYANEQVRLCGEVMPVDIVAPGDCIPVADQSFDFVINSHVVEHFFDPIGAIKEWMRIATQYIFIICPQRDALESDKDKPLTSLEDHIMRFETGVDLGGLNGAETDEHHSRWTCQSFCNMLMWIYTQDWGKDWETCAVEDPDHKVGNGFTVVLKKKTA